MDTRYTSDKAITCFLIASAYVSARGMFGGAYAAGNVLSCQPGIDGYD